MTIEVNMEAPDFTLPDDNGILRSLSDYLGKPVVLYFYPREIPRGAQPKRAISGMTTAHMVMLV